MNTTSKKEKDEEKDEEEEALAKLLERLLLSQRKQEEEKQQQLLTTPSYGFDQTKPNIDKLCEKLVEKKFQNIVLLVGAGASTSAGIPDFRTPGTGLYDNLQKYDLPDPTSIFQLDYFFENPYPFFDLARAMFPGEFNPTPTHHFIKLLHQKGILHRCYTQNIDTLEISAEIPEEKLVFAHGSFATATCTTCGLAHSSEHVKKAVFHGDKAKIPICVKDGCRGYVKPDIVFFGENLPARFFNLQKEDFEKCDLLLVIGTSLQVYPFAGLVAKAKPETPRVLINREKVGLSQFRFDSDTNVRDLFLQGSCDDTIFSICDRCGWTNDLKKLIESNSNNHHDSNNNSNNSNNNSNTEKNSNVADGSSKI